MDKGIEQEPGVERFGLHPIAGAFLKICLFTVLAAQPIFVYLAEYVDTDCDDKAVHFYAAAYLFGPAAKRQAIRERISAWVEAEDLIAGRQRMASRLTGAANYIAADVFIRGIRAWQLRGGQSPDNVPYYSWAVRIAFLSMLVVALANLLVASWRCPPGVWFILLTVNLVAFTVIRVPVLVSGPRDTMHSFISYVPRGSATLFVLAMFLAYGADRKWHFAMSALMLYLWHGGLSILMLSISVPVLIVTDRLVERCAERDDDRGAGSGIVWRLFYPLTALAVCICAVLVTKASAHPLPASSSVGLSPEVLPAIWSSIVYVVFFVGLAYVCLRTRIVDSRDVFSVRFLIVSVAFVFVCGLCGVLVANDASRGAIERLSGTHLVYEIPKRLSGARYLVQSCVIAFVAWVFIRNYWRLQAGLSGWRRKLLATGAAIGMVIAVGTTVRAVVHSHPMHELVLSGKASLFRDDECEHIKRIPLSRDTLSDLDPLQEPEFFYSLGEWLMEGDGK